LRWQCGDLGNFSAFERALAREPRNIELWRSFVITLTQGDLYEESLAAVSKGREAAGPHVLFDVNEAVALSELGQPEAADALFTRLAGLDEPTFRVRYVRHLLRTGRPAEAAAEAEAGTRGPQPHFFWPYVATAWRQTGDPRWDWLEGDTRLVGIYDLAESLPPLDALAERLRSLHRTSHQPLEQSVRGGTQTQGTLFSRVEPEIRALRAAIVAAVEKHVAQLPPPDPAHPTLSVPRGARVRFSGSWSVRLTGGGHHANHIHPMGWFSSALYVVLPDEAARGERPAGWLTLGQPQAEIGLDLAPFRTVEPKPGRLVLFPSTMWHGTIPFAAGERLTVAFDVARPA
ncbi:MAG TPA: putative 2OG-Fe(II) oxygenase, partial [Allosphingosinicella sp.]|nr:putative 2OG-Fe(II) oxygenase [Allosphingosinicella sp.]